MPLLEVQSINVLYGKVHILRDVSMIVNEGEIVGLIGANGAGKTTLLKAISGFAAISNGSVKFRDANVGNQPTHLILRKGIAHVMEGRRLFPHMTVEDNLELGAYSDRGRLRKTQNMKMVYDLFPILAERRFQLAKTFSGGEQQMLAIARGLMANPEILMLDEPSQGLSPVLCKNIYSRLVEINRQGITMLLVEQDVQKSLSLSVRGYVLENGEIILEGKAKDLLQNAHLRKAYLGL